MSEKPDHACAKCGIIFKSDSPSTCGAADLRIYKEGDWVPDVLFYLCADCSDRIIQIAEQKIYRDLDDLVKIKSSI